jgi:GNAT superfamily N-acetyltransferase
MSAQALSVPPGGPSITVRRARIEDAPVCGRVCYDAFCKISTDHGFPPDIPSPEAAVGLLSKIFSHPGFYCVVAESDGCTVGSNCLDERSVIAGVGPITVDPSIQNRGVGRKLMDAVLVRARERNFPGVRLLQSAFHNRSLALYSQLGFDAREPVSVMQGPPLRKRVEGCSVRPAKVSDVEDCKRVCMRVHGHDRVGELADAIKNGTAMVVERGERITGYTTVMAFFGHAVAESNLDLQALIASAEAFAGPGILVPTRNSDLFRWCLENSLRIVQPMTLMSSGLYNEPAGAYLPSVLF